MAKKRLSDTTIRNQKPGKKEIVLSDGAGLTVRVFPSGRKSFCWRYVDKFRNNKMSRIEYGDYPARKLSDARSIHERARSVFEKLGLTMNDRKVMGAYQEFSSYGAIAA